MHKTRGPMQQYFFQVKSSLGTRRNWTKDDDNHDTVESYFFVFFEIKLRNKPLLGKNVRKREKAAPVLATLEILQWTVIPRHIPCERTRVIFKQQV